MFRHDGSLGIAHGIVFRRAWVSHHHVVGVAFGHGSVGSAGEKEQSASFLYEEQDVALLFVARNEAADQVGLQRRVTALRHAHHVEVRGNDLHRDVYASLHLRIGDGDGRFAFLQTFHHDAAIVETAGRRHVFG